ncbi:MAG: CapA family protein [Oscillospiraceae bacterium]
MQEIKSRNIYWDNIKGFLILLTVFAHILYQLQDQSTIINSIVDYIYMFHMPAFVFVCGYFGKSEHSRSFEAIIKLVFLYFIFNSIMGFIYGFGSLLQPMYSYWFLLALIVWRITAPHIAKFKEILLILFVTALFAGFYESIDNTLSAARIIGFYPFYMAGYLLTKEKSEALETTKYPKRFMIGMGSLLVTAAFAFLAYKFFTFSDGDFQMSYYTDPTDAFGRIVLYIIAALAIFTLRNISPCSKIPLITMFGRNSLWIFLLHRPFTLLISDFIQSISIGLIIIISVIAALILCIIFGNDIICKYTNRFVESGAAIFTSEGNKKTSFAQIAVLVVALGFIASVIADSYSGMSLTDISKMLSGESFSDDENTNENNESDVFYPIMTAQQKEDFDKAFRITFAGDLILLEDQVKRAYNGTDYDFSDVFEYTKKYISSAELAIGVFEGPMAGEEAGYSSSNFDDNKTLALNYPDSFAKAVKDAGFDLVTTANNHLLDKGLDGAIRTLDTLDSIQLEHTGSYRNAEEKKNKRVKLIEQDGIRMAVLSYTYGSNYYDNSELIDGSLSYITSVISGTSGEQFEKLKANVEQDFIEAKALDPDLIIVLPHIGTQFSNEPDEEQEVWFDIFKQNGADIILGDHPHVVEPVTIEEYDGRNVFTAYCPGNFANIYREKQGDTSMLVDVYINRDTKDIIGGSIVPLYTQSAIDGNYRALPIYDIIHDNALRKQLSTDDLARAENSNKIISNVVLGNEMNISTVTERYYFEKNGFIRSKANGLILTDEMKSGKLFRAMQNADSVCFIGDSVTEGTKNGGCPWYEPIEEYIFDKTIYNFSKGGCTVSYMTDNIDKIPEADLYVIALGTNDVRYRDESICAMTAEDYVSKLDTLKNMLSERNRNAKFIFIAPWYSVDGDPFCKMSFSEKTAMNEEYSIALEDYCRVQNVKFINANSYIREKLSSAPNSRYLLDHIHPNCSSGVVMYSEAVLLA